VAPDFANYWTGFQHFPVGFMDDGKEVSGKVLHSPRIPLDSGTIHVKMNEVMLLHLQYTYWERMLAKQVWYQIYERYHYPKKSYVDIYEQYNHFKYLQANASSLPSNWLYNDDINGFSIKLNVSNEPFFWQEQIEQMLQEKGVEYYSKLMIWEYPFMRKYKSQVSASFFSRTLLPELLSIYGGLPNRFYKRWFRNFLIQMS
jgi:hypothetical protein